MCQHCSGKHVKIAIEQLPFGRNFTQLGTQPVRPGSNPGGACRSVSVSLDNGGSFLPLAFQT